MKINTLSAALHENKISISSFVRKKSWLVITDKAGQLIDNVMKKTEMYIQTEETNRNYDSNLKICISVCLFVNLYTRARDCMVHLHYYCME